MLGFKLDGIVGILQLTILNIGLIDRLIVIYLVIMGSLVGYSAYVWLLSVRPATQVSTNAYVNPVVAVLLGVLFGEMVQYLLCSLHDKNTFVIAIK